MDPREELRRVQSAIDSHQGLRGVLADVQLDQLIAPLKDKKIALLAQLSGAGAIAQDHGVAAGAGGVAVGGHVFGDVKIETVHVDREDPAWLRTAYLLHVREATSHLPLAGVDPSIAGRASEALLPLDAVYTALFTQTPRTAERPDDPSESLRNEPKRPFSALEQVHRHPRLVLLGDPGSGKSTFPATGPIRVPATTTWVSASSSPHSPLNSEASEPPGAGRSPEPQSPG